MLLQKLVVILIGLVMSLVGAFSPSGLFAAQQGAQLSAQAEIHEETLTTLRAADGAAFARVSVLWVEVDGRRVTEDAWGTGEVKEIKFKVGVKGDDGMALAVGERIVPLKPTDVLTVRMFKGDFSYRGVGTPTQTLQLQGTVKTTTVTQGEVTNRVQTQAGPVSLDGNLRSTTGQQDVAYVVLDTGKKVETVSLESGGARLYTEEAAEAKAATAQVGNLLAKWVKIDGKPVREYTWGDGTLGSIEFEPAEGAKRTVVLAYNGEVQEVTAGTRVVIQDFVGEYLVYQVPGGNLRVRLDGYAGDYDTGAHAALATLGGTGDPLPAFTWQPEAPRTTDTVQFTDDSKDLDGLIVFRRWDFGDNTSSILQNPTHRYQKPGDYVVVLNVTDNDLRTAEYTDLVKVRNADPVPDFDFSPKVITTDTLVSFTDHSYDPDGNVSSYLWDFGDGATSTLRHPTHEFDVGGSATVTLTVTDELSGRAQVSKVILVRNTPPQADFTFTPPRTTTYAPVLFTDASGDRDGRVTAWNWSFGDGAFDSAQNTSHEYTRPGTYTITLRVTDNGGDSSTASTQITIDNRPPVVDFTWDPIGAPSDRPVTFQSRATDKDGAILLQSWDFGDGTPIAIGGTVTHYFPRAGTYPVKLTVTDNSRSQVQFERGVTINDSAPRASMSISANPAFRNEPITFADTTTDTDGDAILNRTWHFGDNSLDATDATVRHTYGSKGEFQVRLDVTDARNKSSWATQTIYVLNRPPTASVTVSPDPPVADKPFWLNGSASDLDDAEQNLTYRWTLPGNLEATGKSQPLTLPAGTYTATLRVNDTEGGFSAPIVKTFTVALARPVVAFTHAPNITAMRPEPLFDASSSGNGPIVERQWVFGQDGSTNATNPIHNFSRGGDFLVRLSVKDSRGVQNTLDQTIVINWPPTPIFEAPVTTIPRNGQAFFNDTSTDLDGQVVRSFWDFGDGATLDCDLTVGSCIAGGTGTLALPDPTHTYTTPGPKMVYLTVWDEKGAASTLAKEVRVENVKPIARWQPSVASPTVGQAITFDSLNHSYDPDGTPIVKWRWVFSDGFTSNEANPVHAFPRSGTYTVTLVVNDGEKDSDIDAGAYRLMRAGANHAITIRVQGNLPGNPASRVADLNEANYSVAIRWGSGAAAQERVSAQLVPDGSALTLTIPMGDWTAGDPLMITLRAAYLPNPMVRTLTLADNDGVLAPLNFAFDIAQPLVTHVEAQDGTRGGIVNASLWPEVDGDGWAIYRDMGEPFRGTGWVRHLDGQPAYGARVNIEARYLPLMPVGGIRDSQEFTSIDTFLLGWCRAATVFTNVDGGYQWDFDASNPSLAQCAFPGAKTMPLGRWEVRAVASHTFATSDTSEPAGIWVDPTGGYLVNLPLV